MNPGAGNRQDNRQRGNAAQLLEKYKGLARDMQMQGDRVQTEYYLQFSDHYYRILNESRARFDEQRRQRGEGYESGYDEDEQEELEAAPEGREREGREESEPREAREEREPREARAPRETREPREYQAEGSRDQGRPGNGEYRGRRPRGRYAEEGERYEGAEGGNESGEERLAADILPPSIGAMKADAAEVSSDADEAPRAPRRRPRRPRDEPGEEIAPAA